MTLSAPLRASLNVAREALLDLHKVLLEYERSRYERSRGAIDGSYQFLQLVISDPWFAWLRPMSGLVVAIDEQLLSKEVVPQEDAELLLVRTRELLTPVDGGAGFGGRLHQVMQSAPAVALRYSQTIRTLDQS